MIVDSEAIQYFSKSSSPSLPVLNHKFEILYLLEQVRVLVIMGHTGSGKTTQIPQYLYGAGYCDDGKLIACTQPRRIAVTSVATRVSDEIGTTLGQLVGYSIRFDEASSSETRIKYMTDGMLFREALNDPLLSKYSVIMLDEAHEQSLFTDLLVGLLKKILRKRMDLKVIVSSATLDAEAFNEFFQSIEPLKGKAPHSSTILTVEGKSFPTEIHYLPHSVTLNEIVKTSVETVVKIHKTQKSGDILIFLTGRDEIEKAISLLNSYNISNLIAIPLYAGLSKDQQARVFDPIMYGRKAIFATNIAEASVTIDGVDYVVDCGTVKLKVFNPESGIDALLTVKISQASAAQRAGRAGRTAPGKVYRLYSYQQYVSFRQHSIPEIERCNLVSVILSLKALGIDNILSFDFMYPLPAENLTKALEYLFAIGALNADAKLTQPIGYQMAEMPIEPAFAKLLISSATIYSCSAEMLTIVAMLTVGFPHLVFGGSKSLEASIRKFAVEEGDLITFCNIYNSWDKSHRSPSFSSKYSLSQSGLTRAARVRQHLAAYMHRLHLPCNLSSQTRIDQLIACIASAFFSQAAQALPDGSYRPLNASPNTALRLYIHPSSVLFRRVPNCVLYSQIEETDKIYMSALTVLDPDELKEAAPHYYEERPLARF